MVMVSKRDVVEGRREGEVEHSAVSIKTACHPVKDFPYCAKS